MHEGTEDRDRMHSWPVSVEERRIAEVSRRLAAAGLDDVRLAPNVPPKMERNIRDKAKIAEDESILALVDCTIFNSGKDALVVGAGGLWYHHACSSEAPAFQPWASIARGPVRRDQGMTCQIGSAAYDLVGSGVDPIELCTVVADLAGLLGDLTGGDVTDGDFSAGDWPVDDVGRSAALGPIEAGERSWPLSADERRAVEARRLLTEAGLDDLHVAPNVPSTMERNIRKKAGIPDDEPILALVDCTVFDSGKDALVVGGSGLWYHYPFETGDLAFQAWESVHAGPIEALGGHDCRIGTFEYQLGGSLVNVPDLCGLIDRLADLLRQQSDTPQSDAPESDTPP